MRAARMAARVEASVSGPAVASDCGSTPGSVIAGTYRIVRLLGRGGMGEVYEAEHVRLGRPFAIKLLKNRGDHDAMARFQREARAISRLDTEHVVSVVDTGTLEDGRPYLVMERLVGSDLRGLLTRDGPLPVRRATACIQQACFGISAAHAAGVIHRDLKPENLFIVERERGETCKVLDFGAAKLEASEFTQQGAVIGTVKYMAPEQLMDNAEVGVPTDIYALGAILYECLIGRAPHAADGIQKIMFKILNTEADSIPFERPGMPPQLEAVVRRALEREPGRRFQTAQAFANALGPFTQAFASTAVGSSDDTQDLEGSAIPAKALRRGSPSPRTIRTVVAAAFTLGLGVPLGWIAKQRSESRSEANQPYLAPAVEASAWRVPDAVRAPTGPEGGELSPNAAASTGMTMKSDQSSPPKRLESRPPPPRPSARLLPSANGNPETPPSASATTGSAPNLGSRTFVRENPYAP